MSVYHNHPGPHGRKKMGIFKPHVSAADNDHALGSFFEFQYALIGQIGNPVQAFGQRDPWACSGSDKNLLTLYFLIPRRQGSIIDEMGFFSDKIKVFSFRNGPFNPILPLMTGLSHPLHDGLEVDIDYLRTDTEFFRLSDLPDSVGR